MVVSNINTNLSGNINFNGLLKKNKEEVMNGETLTENNLITSNVKSISISANSVSSESIMSRNFVGATSQSSSVEATMSNFQSKKQMALSSHQILAAATEKVLSDNDIDKTNTGSKAAVEREMRRISNKKVIKESQKNLDEIKKKIDQSAEEALAPKDEYGKPIDVSTGNSGQTSEVSVLPTRSGESATILQSAERIVIQDAAPVQETPSINIKV